MLFGLALISLAISNLHAAVFYVFFVLLLPYFAEYIFILVKELHLIHKITMKFMKYRIERAVRKQKSNEEIEKIQAKLVSKEENFIDFEKRSNERIEAPYKIKLIKRENVKWLCIVAIICFAMGLLTPIGNEPYTHIFKLMAGDTLEGIAEHQPLVLYGHVGAIITLTILFVVLIFTDTKITLKDLFMLLGLIVLMFSARRQYSLLLIIRRTFNLKISFRLFR